MSRILLADDSPHAQRIGEFILREEGFEVVTVTDGVTAVVRLADVDPDLILADVSLPEKNGYDLCEYVKKHASHRHTKVILTAGAQEPFDEEESRRVGADGSLRKPFEASVVIEAAKRLVEAAVQARKEAPPEPLTAQDPPLAAEPPAPEPTLAQEPPAAEEPADVPEEPETVPVVEVVVEAPPTAPLPVAADPQTVRAAVTLALECALPVLIDEVTQRVLVALEQDKPAH